MKPLTEEQKALFSGHIARMAGRYAKVCGEAEDYANEGWLGLTVARRKHDPSSHPNFEGYALKSIRGYMINSMQRNFGGVMLPKGIYKVARMVDAGRLREDELSRETRERLASARVVMRAWRLGEKATDRLTVAGSDAEPEEPGEEGEARARIRAAMACLKPRERVVISHRFGIDGCPVESHAQLAARLGRTHGRTEHILSEALAKLAARLGGPVRHAKTLGDPARKYVGVYHKPEQPNNPWGVRILIEGKLRCLGAYHSDTAGAIAYDDVARRLGRPVNFPRDGEQQAIAGRARSGHKRRDDSPPVGPAP